MSALESQRPREAVEDPARHSGVVETKKKNEQLTPAERVKRTLVYSGVLGRSLVRILEGERPRQEVERLEEVSLILRRGEELRSLDISEHGKKGANFIEVRHYANPEKDASAYIVAFAKPEGGQAVLRYQDAALQLMGGDYEVREDGKVLHRAPQFTEPKDKAGFPTVFEDFKEALVVAAKHYRVPVEALLKRYVEGGEFSHRISIPPEQAVRAERVVPLHDQFYGLKTALVTELRKQEGVQDEQGKVLHELCSVQQLAPALDSETPMAPLSEQTGKELEKQGKEHPLAVSIMRLVVLHCLTRQGDGHQNNLLAPKEKTAEQLARKEGVQTYTIDAALSFPLASRGEAMQDPRGKVWNIQRTIDPILSYPLHLIEQHPDWILDDEARGTLQKRVDACREWMDLFDRDPDATDLDEMNQEVEFLLNSFLFLRGHNLTKDEQERDMLLKIAKQDMRGQLEMAAYIAENGRPPELSLRGMTLNALFSSSEGAAEPSKQGEEEIKTAMDVSGSVRRQKKVRSPSIDVTGETVFHTGSNPFSR